MGFSTEEYWSELPFPSPGNLPQLEIKPTSPVFPALQADSSPSEPPGKPLCNVASIKTQKEGIQRASRLVDQNSSTGHLAEPKLQGVETPLFRTLLEVSLPLAFDFHPLILFGIN